jgi:hypothetical protein
MTERGFKFKAGKKPSFWRKPESSLFFRAELRILDSRLRGNECAREGATSARWKSASGYAEAP